MPRKTDRPEGAKYRCDWNAGADKSGFVEAEDRLMVTDHPTLADARQQARRKSKKHGTAYVIESVDGKDVAQLAYAAGDVDGGTHNWETRR